MFKKISSILIAALFFLLFLSQNAYVQAATPTPIKSIKIGPCGVADGNDRFGILCSRSTAANTDTILRNIVIGAMTFAAILALLFLIFGGFKWITSGGDKTKIEAARNMIIAAIIGLILTLLSYFILSTILKIFGINLLDLSIPQLQN